MFLKTELASIYPYNILLVVKINPVSKLKIQIMKYLSYKRQITTKKCPFQS